LAPAIAVGRKILDKVRYQWFDAALDQYESWDILSTDND
jgi:hypothetical protein